MGHNILSDECALTMCIFIMSDVCTITLIVLLISHRLPPDSVWPSLRPRTWWRWLVCCLLGGRLGGWRVVVSRFSGLRVVVSRLLILHVVCCLLGCHTSPKFFSMNQCNDLTIPCSDSASGRSLESFASGLRSGTLCPTSKLDRQCMVLTLLHAWPEQLGHRVPDLKQLI